MKTAYVEIRCKGAKRGRTGHSGPDRYVAVQVVPKGVQPLKVLNHRAAAKRGIEIIHCGDGYALRTKTPRSSLNRAIAKAKRIADEINNSGKTV